MYKHIVVAVDWSEENQQVINKAISFQQLNTSHLSLIHVLEPVGGIYDEVSDVQHKRKEASDAYLNKIIEENSLADATCITLKGNAAAEIHRYVKDHAVDLIITGSHGIHGVQLLLGSTANHILHGAKCDVLAVRIQN